MYVFTMCICIFCLYIFNIHIYVYIYIHMTSIKRKRGEKDNCPKLKTVVGSRQNTDFVFDFGKMRFFKREKGP